MEAYPGYRCSNCGGYTNMYATGHAASGFGQGWLCERPQTEGLLPLDHYDLGPELSINFDAKAKRWERWRLVEGRLVKDPLSEVEALAVVWEQAPELRRHLKRPDDLDERLQAARAESERQADEARFRSRTSPLAG